MLITKCCLDKLQLEVYDSISDLDAKTWNNTLAMGHPFKTHGFIRACELALPHRQYRYFKISVPMSNSMPIGLFFGTEEKVDLASEANSYLRSLLRSLRKIRLQIGYLTVAMLGCLETSGRHWWFSNKLDSKQHIPIISRSLELGFPQAVVRIIRDLENEHVDYQLLHSQLIAHKFYRAMNYPLALISLDGQSWEQHCLRLKANCRKVLNRMTSKFLQSNWRIAHYHHQHQFLPMEVLYEQYLNTHREAREFKREALPFAFFKCVMEECHVVISVLYDQENQARSFIFSGISDIIINPFVFGRDYYGDNDVNYYYALHLDLIKTYNNNGVKKIDLGITNYFVKQTFGAHLQRNSIYMKIRSPLLNMLFGRALAKHFDIIQPRERSVFKYDDQT